MGAEHSTVDAEEDGHVIGSTTLPLVQPGQAVLHVALRAPAGTKILLDGRDVVADVHEVLP